MKMFQKAPLALAITALLTAPYALANDFNVDVDIDKDFTSDVNLDIDKKYNKDVNVEYENIYSMNQDYDVSVDLEFEGYSSASVASKQLNSSNTTNNVRVDNEATVDGNALRGASGNIGVNIATGDNNQQANDAALAASDAEHVFAMASAQSLQAGVMNQTNNKGVNNNANLGGNALRNAAGNIGVNIASGSSNLQQNSLAASVSSSTVAEASAGGAQLAYANTTNNAPHSYTTQGTQDFEASFEIDASNLKMDQIGDVYPDTWGADTNDGQHESSPGTGHIDLDNQADGAVDLNGDGGALAFSATEDSILSGTISGAMPAEITVVTFHDNTASLGGNALRGASGNIGVNIASGSNNMQRNSLALSASAGGAQ